MIHESSRWSVAPVPDRDRTLALARALNIPDLLAALLLQRGYVSSEEVRTFLRPSLGTLSDPFLMRDMPKAVGLVADAVRSGQTILVHGDYDVDGQCASALLTRVLKAAGGKVETFVPHRLRDGYDFGPAGVEAARQRNASLIVTCDCGVTACEAVSQARRLGIRVVVTDHHVPHELPDADAIVNPRRPDCDSPAKELCGTGVAFKLAQALVQELDLPENLPWYLLDLVALATVADVVQLTGENRVLVRFGLKLLAQSHWPGVRALVEAAGLGGKELRAGHVGFILAPRLNATGRIGDAMDGVRLLLADEMVTARRYAKELEALNTRRQAVDQQILGEAVAAVRNTVDLEKDYGLVLAKEGWHPGVVGIVASRIVERYTRPVIVVALDGEEGRGSGRSIPGFDLHGALAECAVHLKRYGGHPMAVGLTIEPSKVAEFRRAFNEIAHAWLTPERLIPSQRIDFVISLNEIGFDLERLLRHLEPCGPGNPAPVFGVAGARALEPRAVGDNHLKFTLRDGTANLSAIGFDWADRVRAEWLDDALDVAFRVERDDWRGDSTLQARVVDIKPAA